MARHDLGATRDTVIDHFSKDTRAVLRIDPGDTVTVESLDANGYLEPMTEPGRQSPTMFTGKRGHCLTGPIAVNGTSPGQTLSVTFVSLRPGDWGWTIAGHKDNALTRRPGVAGDVASLYVGDGHAAQGDGEVAGTAIECPMTTEILVDVVDDDVPGVHATTPTARITFGFNADLNEATATALDNMLVWMRNLYGLDKSTALALAGPVVDLRITQVANNTWGVHAVLPHDAIVS